MPAEEIRALMAASGLREVGTRSTNTLVILMSRREGVFTK